jgi:hypothetical protein
MLTPPDPYLDLLKRTYQSLVQEKVDNQLLEVLQQAFEKVFDQNHILLSRAGKKRLFHQASKLVLTDVLAKLDDDN